MRALLTLIGVIALVLIVLGLILETARWLIIIGAVVILGMLILSMARGRRPAQRNRY